MLQTTITVPEVNNSSRDERMEQLLNQMAASFKKAFPTAKDLVEWLALTNDLIFQDKYAKDADSAACFTFYLGYTLLPTWLQAKTDDDILDGIKTIFTSELGCLELNHSIPFIMSKYLTSNLEASDNADSHIDTIKILRGLEQVAILGNEYASWEIEARDERRKAYKENETKQANPHSLTISLTDVANNLKWPDALSLSAFKPHGLPEHPKQESNQKPGKPESKKGIKCSSVVKSHHH